MINGLGFEVQWNGGIGLIELPERECEAVEAQCQFGMIGSQILLLLFNATAPDSRGIRIPLSTVQAIRIPKQAVT